MRKRESRNFVLPLFVVFAAAMLVMAILSVQFSVAIFFVELVISLAALAAVIIWIVNLKKFVSAVLTSSSKRIFKDEARTIDDLGVPAVVLGPYNEILAANVLFTEDLCGGEDPLGDNIKKYLSGEDANSVFGNNGTDTSYKGRWYIAFGVRHEYGAVVYFIDDNQYKLNSDEYLESRPVVGIVAFDNKDELERETDNSEAIQVTVAVETEIVKWVAQTNGFYKKISGGRYFVVMEERDIHRFVDEKFRLLDDIRTIKINDRLNATVSVGLGRGGDTFKENEQWARQALDMALGRGGDQVAIKKGDSYQFFGGMSKGIEKRDKVRTRVIASTLTTHINNSSNVIIMGHRFSDLDSVGSCIGMWSAVVKGLHKNGYILLNRQQTLAKPLVSSVEKAGLEGIFRTEDEALPLIDDHTLLIIVDTHNPNFLESKAVYEKCSRVVVIDHHRMMVNHIDKALVFYHEPYASSASEMTAELIQYLGHESLSRLESEALLAGIMLDTKNFVLRTGVRTFEAAAYLKSKGADTVEVKRLFSNSIDTYKVKYKLVSEAEIFNFCAIASAEEDIPDIRIASAQAADELLGIENVKASFVMYKTGKTTNISARSLGDLNVQVIMEQLGGGGHQTMAACQLENTGIAEAREKLVSIISELDVNKDD